MDKINSIVVLCVVLALAAGCTPVPVGSSPSSAARAPNSTTPPTADSRPKDCTRDADCSAGQVCNCRCSAGQPCNGPAYACGDCGRLKTVGICRVGCEGEQGQ